MHRILSTLVLATACILWVVPSAFGVSGAGYTTVNTAVDGSHHCKNGNPEVNCNIYDGKEFVWLNGGPAANGLGPDGQYFFAVLAPGGQPNPNDGGAKNLSDDFDGVANRTFTVTNGEVTAYAGTHTYSPPLIRLFPYADTPNPGGVYIMAICSLDRGYPVAPRDCKYDAFKVQKGQAKVQSVLSGQKYFDTNKNGQHDAGEPGLADWSVTISGNDGTKATVVTDGAGNWTYTTSPHTPAPGSITYTISEVQQSGWTQTGNTVDQSIAMGGASVSLANFTYNVTVPKNAVSAVEQLNFGNWRDNPPVCPPPTTSRNANGQPILLLTVQDTDTGLAAINVVYTRNITVDIAGFSFGTTSPVTVTGTAIDAALSMGLTFEAVDLAGNVTVCDPVAGSIEREAGVRATETFTGLLEDESKVTITNGTPGVSSVELNVNGTVFRLTGLGDGESRSIDVASAMQAGTANTVTLVARGRPGAIASFLISN